VLLGADGICLPKPGSELLVYLARRGQPEIVDYVSRRNRIDTQEARVVEPPGQDQMPIQPEPARHERRETHPHVQGDARFLGEYLDGAEGRDHREHGIERGPNAGLGVREVLVQAA
jgi:hypothetical protein